MTINKEVARRFAKGTAGEHGHCTCTLGTAR